MRKKIGIVCAVAIGLILMTGGFWLFGSGKIAEGSYSNSKVMASNTQAGRVSVKQYGAVGDGQHDDYDAFNSAINSGMSEIYVPAGTYYLGNKTVDTGYGISLIGENQAECVIKNGAIRCRHGVSVSNLTFDGGAPQTINYTGGMPENGTVIMIVSPNGQQNVSYKNCTFKNATVASFAREETGSFFNDEINGCTFSNIRKVAVYHSLNIGNANYLSNTFENIGGNDINNGFVSALWIGDVTNNTYVQAVNTVIDGNVFNNLVTKDDFSGTGHSINANFIAIRSDKAVINNNKISNLVGYGQDREAVYTKVRELTISSNVITEGGMGEGYICNKSQTGDSYCTITGNTITGNAGCAIRSYVPGTISGNAIAITNCSSVITNSQRDNITGNKELIIRENAINCGTASELNVNGTVVSKYSTGQAIRITKVKVPIIVEKNSFNTSTPFTNYISVGNPGDSVTIRYNNINRADKDGTGISVYSTKNNGILSAGKINVEKNQFGKGAVDR